MFLLDGYVIISYCNWHYLVHLNCMFFTECALLQLVFRSLTYFI